MGRHAWSISVAVVLTTIAWPLLGCHDSESGSGSQVLHSNGPNETVGWTTPQKPIDCVSLTSHCLGPMPSNLFTRRDPWTRTGLRVNLTDRNLSEGVFAYAAEYLGPSLLNMGDGFSPASRIIIPLEGPVAAEDLAEDLASSVRADCAILLIDTVTGSPVPYHIRVDPKGLQQRPPEHFLVMTPAQLLRPATAHVVILRSNLQQPDGTPAQLYTAFEQIKSLQPLEDPLLRQLQDLYRDLFSFLEDTMDVQRDSLLFAFDFTTRSEESLLAPMRHLRTLVEQYTNERPPSAAMKNPQPGFLAPSAACQISGNYPAPSFRDRATKILSFDTHGLPSIHGTNTVPFLLHLPEVPAGDKAPIVVFGHGLWVFKETVLQIAEDLLRAGFAVISVDAACHGARRFEDGYIAELFQLETVEQAVSCLSQTVADELTLVDLLKGDLSDLDLLPYSPGQDAGDGVPDLDTDHIYYVGQSMGTVIGLTFVALCEDVPAAVLNVPGAGIINIVTNGEITYPMVGSQFIPRGTTSLDAHLLYTVAQMYVDYVDPIHFAPLLHGAPSEGNGEGRHVLLQGSLNDGLIPNWCTDMLTRTIGIPVMEPYAYLPYGVSSLPMPAHGSGLYQYSFSRNPLAAHGVLFLVPECRSQLVEYLRTHYLEGKPVIRDPFEADS